MKLFNIETVLYVGLLTLFPVSLVVFVYCVGFASPLAMIWSAFFAIAALMVWPCTTTE